MGYRTHKNIQASTPTHVLTHVKTCMYALHRRENGNKRKSALKSLSSGCMIRIHIHMVSSHTHFPPFDIYLDTIMNIRNVTAWRLTFAFLFLLNTYLSFAGR